MPGHRIVALSAPPVSVVEARGSRYERHERAKDYAELLDLVDGDDSRYHHP